MCFSLNCILLMLLHQLKLMSIIISVVPVLSFVSASMLPLLIKDHLVIAFVALVVIFYLVADLCLSQTDSTSSMKVESSSGDSDAQTSQLNADKTLTLLVCNSVSFSNT